MCYYLVSLWWHFFLSFLCMRSSMLSRAPTNVRCRYRAGVASILTCLWKTTYTIRATV